MHAWCCLPAKWAGSDTFLVAVQRYRGNVRIPLKEVVRFKEKQWFVEELEVRVIMALGRRQALKL